MLNSKRSKERHVTQAREVSSSVVKINTGHLITSSQRGQLDGEALVSISITQRDCVRPRNEVRLAQDNDKLLVAGTSMLP
jgi:hypothetical protein